ncbi:MAG: disulfide bond formation protein DsbA [Brevundimonas sp.]|uniref:DsbA family oxidoreductase n=1 Tax=Brevundimonas albigilva TaxID=1312364 RepID=A0ABY4SPZ1_9CAUL|nr:MULTISPECIES: DsbA family oxidoreductase [Brevundimonas]PZU54380.1 MAG: disulfide bond formation protein DsbA [Brevundimonas sp.]UQV17131.1 DsbA family oxidoreductase [Brevundimonas albigilva]URI15129.1 DsbA family oxidoreductase [Brevundimonas albigilva]
MTDTAPQTSTPAPLKTLKIDFVSDVVCPWCVVGLGGLETALERLEPEGIAADIAFQPFELNPDMAPEGEGIVEHIGRKYGSTPEQSAANREMIKARAAEAGFDMRMGETSRIWNTFDAHRLLHWAHETAPDKQKALKRALFTAHFTDNRNLTDAGVLTQAAEAAGLDRAEAAEVLASGRYAQAVRQAEQLWRSRGINSVPAVVVEGKYLISGGQPAEAFEQALRQIAKEA